MSTKNLARTAIEGGRTGSNKWDRRYSHKETRAEERTFLHEVQDDLENYYEYDIPATRHVYKEFNDKLGPMYRWLERQVGKPWDEVRSEVTKAFDTRTTAGRHIVYDHLLNSVEVTPDVRFRYYRNTGDENTSHYKHDFFVNDEGILCQRIYIPRRQKLPSFDTKKIANWLNGRVVGLVGKKLFWFVPADKGKKRGGYNHQWECDWGRRSYYYESGLRFKYLSYKPIYKTDSVGLILLDEKGAKIVKEYKESWVYATPYAFRQDRKLSEKELSFWNTIPEHYQIKVLENSPTYPTPAKPDYRYYY